MTFSLFVFWLLLSIAVAIFAARYHRAGFGWFLLSLILSPLIGFAFVAALGPRPAVVRTRAQEDWRGVWPALVLLVVVVGGMFLLWATGV